MTQPPCSMCEQPLVQPVALPTYADRRCASCVALINTTVAAVVNS